MTGELKTVFSLLAEREQITDEFVGDSVMSKEVSLSINDANIIKDSMYDMVRGNLTSDGSTLMTLTELEKNMSSVMPTITKMVQNRVGNMKMITDALKSGKPLNDPVLQDGFFNALTGTGVGGFDPGSFNLAYTPVSMSPNEATSYYSNGGIPAIIIDKKVKGALINGYNFVSNNEETGLTEDDRLRLKEYANSVGFDQQIEHTDRDGLIYGGAFLYPVFNNDDPSTYDMPIKELFERRIIDKDCISYFVEGDRWNSIMVPNYNITAKDYLSPETYMIPLAGVRVHSERMAIIRPLLLPYWGALRQLGWGRSDFESYVRSILAYKILIASIPIMAQQMSLLVHTIPLDGIIAQNGPASAEQFVQANNARMRAWSMLNPMTINSYGELKAIDRSFADFDKLNMALRQDVAANSGIPESVLFHTLSTGFSDNTEEITYKQSETIRNINNAVIPSYRNIVKILIASCFGPNSPQFKKSDTVRISFDSPDVITNEERGKMFEKFTSGINMLKTAGINVHDSVVIARKFMPEIDISEEIMDNLETENPDPNEGQNSPFNGNGANAPKPGQKEGPDKKMNIKKKEA